MQFESGIHEVSRADASLAFEQATSLGLVVFKIDTARSPTREALFEAIRGGLPLNPATQSSRSWDGLFDSLWSGIDDLSKDDVLIVWNGASELRESDPEGFRIAISFFGDLVESLANDDQTCGEPTQVCLLAS